MPTHFEYAAGLRQIADFLETHGDIPLPEPTLTCYGLYNKETAAVAAKALSHGGRCEKVFADTLVTLSREFGVITLQYHGMRTNVCEQVRVGTRMVPEQYVAPRPAVEAHVVPEHEEAVYEWRCTPLLGKPDVEFPVEQPQLPEPQQPILEGEYEDSIPF
jgi:hypothetical protein